MQKNTRDADVKAAAGEAAGIVRKVLQNLPPAKTFDYGGHELKLGDYNMCERCTRPIAEAQAAHKKLLEQSENIESSTVKEHVELAAEFLRREAEAAEIRAELHNGQGSEPIINELLGFVHRRDIHDNYEHSHAPKH